VFWLCGALSTHSPPPPATAALLSDLPDEPRAWIVDGALKELDNDLEGAERSYRKAHALSPNDAPRRAELEVSFAELARRRGSPATALAALESMTRDAADPIRRMHAVALCLIDLGRLDEALNAAKAIAEKPYGAGVARRLEQAVRERRDAPESRGA
jgi:tetratricopeptide (TPR) repeat protein